MSRNDEIDRTSAANCLIQKVAGAPRCHERPGHVRQDYIRPEHQGRACIRGMRIPVSVIVGQIAHGATWEQVLDGYPDLERADIQQAIEYAAWLTHEEVRTV
jgi:uncharacterized protein (DUF433 family)